MEAGTREHHDPMHTCTQVQIEYCGTLGLSQKCAKGLGKNMLSKEGNSFLDSFLEIGDPWQKKWLCMSKQEFRTLPC